MRAYTDYPFVFLGDVAFQQAPIREVTLLAYDDNKYVMIEVKGQRTSVKRGYLYESFGRLGSKEVDFEGKIPGREKYFEYLREDEYVE